MENQSKSSISLRDIPIEDAQYSGLFRNFMTGTGMHGFPNIANSRSVFRRIMWVLLLLGGFCFMVYQVVELVNKYYSYPVQVQQIVRMNTPTKMPAITFCNINPVKYNQYSKQMPHLDSNSSYRDSLSNMRMKITEIDNKTNMDFGWTNITRNSVPPEKEKHDKFIDSFFNMTEDQQIAMGYKYEDMIVECSYDGKYCVPSMFTQIFNPYYGNCYVFNVNETEITDQSGASNVLGLSFYIDQSSYVPDLTINAGMRLQIHEASVAPLPEDFGISLHPGTLTQIGIRKEMLFKTSSPYGKCHNYSTNDASYLNAYMHTLKELPLLNYTQQACFKTCSQNLTIEKCGCMNPYLPRGNNTAIPVVCGMCQLSNSTIRKCMMKAARESGRRCGPDTNSGCTEECVSTYYDLRTSQSQWPSLPQINPFIMRIMDKNKAVMKQFSMMHSETQFKNYVRENFVRAEIYFEDLNYHTITMSPGYTLPDLLADMGGQVGLWLGLSVLTIFEVVELMFDCCYLIFYKQQTRMLKENIRKSEEKNFHAINSKTPVHVGNMENMSKTEKIRMENIFNHNEFSRSLEKQNISQAWS